MRTRWTSLGVVAAACLAAAVAGAKPATAAVTNVALGQPVTATVDVLQPVTDTVDVLAQDLIGQDLPGLGVLGVDLLPAPKCSAGSGPENAVDGAASNIYTDKWCVPSGNPTLHISLPSSANGYRVSKIVIMHAGAGGEPASLNTRAYTLKATQLQNFFGPTGASDAGGGLALCFPVAARSVVATVTANTANITTHFLSLNHVTDVWLTIDRPTQGTNQATRIYEVQVFGSPDGPLPAC
jgi:hypothetical protein